MARQSWCVLALLCVLGMVSACGGPEDELGPRIPASIVVVPNEPRVPLGQTKQLTATVVDAAGRAIEDQPLRFFSSDTSVLTVSATGLLTAIGHLGSAEITVASGELTARVTAEAVLPPMAIVVQPTELVLQATQSALLSVTVTNELSEPVNDLVSFRSTNPTVAIVDNGGYVTARQKGTCSIVVSSPGRPDVEIPVLVDQIPTTLEVTPTSLVLQPGGQQQLTVRVLDAFGAPIHGPIVSYSSDAAAVATVSTSGLVRAVALGSAVITVTSGTLSTTVGVFVGTTPLGTILANVPLDGGPWGVRTRGDRYFVTGVGGTLYGGQGSNFAFPVSLTVGGLTLDVEVNGAGTRAYVAATRDPLGVEGIAVVDLTTGTVIDVLTGAGTGTMFAVALAPDESHLFVGTGSGAERIDLATGTAAALPGVGGSITTFSRHPTEPRLYGNMGYASVVEIDAEDGDVLRTFSLPTGMFGTVQSTVVSQDGGRLYAAIESGDLLSWDLTTGAPGPWLLGGGGFGLALSPDNQFLYVAREGAVLLVDRASLVLLKTVAVGGRARRIGVRSDGVALAANEYGWVDFIR